MLQSAALALLLGLGRPALADELTRLFSQHKNEPTTLLVRRCERDPKTGWSIRHCSKYTDPADAKGNLEARVVAEAGSNLYSLKIERTEPLVQPTER